jgi:rhodanese-related sulfurtransferase
MSGPGRAGGPGVPPGLVAQVDVREADRRLRAAIDRTDGPLVVDVRELGEIVLGRIDGAAIVPLSEFARRHAELPRDRPLLIVCASGYRSGLAAQFLISDGHRDAANVAGGMHAWEAAGLPVKRGALAPDEGAL